MSFGIDVSEFQGKIHWNTVKKSISFAMIRAGLGNIIYDNCFRYNAEQCTNLGIPFGVYWFSYAYTKEMAKKEAHACLSTVKGFKLKYPIAYDFEYDSDKWATKNNKNLSNENRCEIISTFLDEISKYGYTPMIYTNLDYIYYKGLRGIINNYELWIAATNTDKKPNLNCGIWQYQIGKVDGIDKPVDLDLGYKDYAKLYEENNREVIIRNVMRNFIDDENTFKKYMKVLKLGDGKNGLELREICQKYYCDYLLLNKLIETLKEN